MMIARSFHIPQGTVIQDSPGITTDLVEAYQEGGRLLNVVLWLFTVRWARQMLTRHLPGVSTPAA